MKKYCEIINYIQWLEYFFSKAPRMITQTTPCLFSWCLLLCSGVRLTSGQIAKSSYRYTTLRVPVSQLTIEVTSLD